MSGEQTVTVYIDHLDTAVECGPLETINQAAHEKDGVKIPTSCDIGACLSCTGQLVDEDEDPVQGLKRPGANTLSEAEREQGYTVPCVDRFPRDDDWWDIYGDQTLTLYREFPATLPEETDGAAGEREREAGTVRG